MDCLFLVKINLLIIITPFNRLDLRVTFLNSLLFSALSRVNANPYSQYLKTDLMNSRHVTDEQIIEIVTIHGIIFGRLRGV